jgi:hypothetical protein
VVLVGGDNLSVSCMTESSKLDKLIVKDVVK